MINLLALRFDRLLKIKWRGRICYPNKPSSKAFGFSEREIQWLANLDMRSNPPDIVVQPASSPSYRWVRRLSKDVSAEGGMITGDPDNSEPCFWGHRERLRIQFLAGGQKLLPEYEMLELFLFNPAGRVNVKSLAKRLLVEFGDLNGVVAASRYRLLKVNGTTPEIYLQLRIVEAFAQRMGQAKVLKHDVVTCWDDLIKYCRTSMAHRDTEQFRMLFLNCKNVIVSDEVQAVGTVDHVAVYPREVAKRALELNASAIIMVHNHPSGDPTPSRQDIEMTQSVEMACRSIGVIIHDHVIIGKGQEFSFKLEGLLY